MCFCFDGFRIYTFHKFQIPHDRGKIVLVVQKHKRWEILDFFYKNLLTKVIESIAVTWNFYFLLNRTRLILRCRISHQIIIYIITSQPELKTYTPFIWSVCNNRNIFILLWVASSIVLLHCCNMCDPLSFAVFVPTKYYPKIS